MPRSVYSIQGRPRPRPSLPGLGKLDARAGRRGGVLTVHAIHQDLPFSEG
jgi:hypothetical protein